MRVSPSVHAFVLDQLAGVPGLRARAMFGGIGLYAGDVFFGIVAADVLYFKVDDRTRPEYEAVGSTPFKPYADRPMTMAYYRVPVGVFEDAAQLTRWAKRAVAVASTAAPTKTKKSSRPRVRAKPRAKA
jgi:DNA transformation protein